MPEYVRRLMPSRSGVPLGVTVEAALGLGAVYRCASILATLASGLEIEAIRVGRPVANQPPLIRKPNLAEPRRVTIQTTVTSLALHGEAFWQISRATAAEAPAQITVLNPADVTVRVNDAGNVVYERIGRDGAWREVPAWQLQHLQLFRTPGALRGLGPIQAAQAGLRGALDLELYAGRWWRDSEVPTGILSTDQPLNTTLADQYRDRWSAALAERRTAVLGSGLTYTALNLNPKDALFVETAQLNVVSVARLFGIPATLLDSPSGDSATYSNQQQKNAQLLTLTLSNYLAEIETAWGELLPLGTTARFRADELLRLDDSARMSMYKTAIEAGVLTPDECRLREGLEPLNA